MRGDLKISRKNPIFLEVILPEMGPVHHPRWPRFHRVWGGVDVHRIGYNGELNRRCAMSKVLIEITDLPARFAEMVRKAEAGEEVVITENQVPRAKLVAAPPAGPPPGNGTGQRALGLFLGQIQTT